MKTIKWLVPLCTMTLTVVCSRAQVYSTSMMDLNNVSFHISNSGVLFHNSAIGQAGYSVPKNDGTAVIYAAGLWFGGTDVNGQLKLAAMRYGQNGNDYRPGPYSSSFSYDSSAYVAQYGTSIWSINQGEVEDHIQNFNSPGYVVPQSIEDWPANGDPGLGVAEQLAPYVDFNDNGIYDPQYGDYPLIKGCQALYMILTDHMIHTESGAEAIGLELHFMFYQYEGLELEALSNTTFMDVRAINRSTQTLFDFYGGVFMDGDLGYSGDDFVGCDTLRNLGYMYNGDSMDETNGGQLGYGDTPPAFGILSLNTPLSSFSFMTSAAFYPQTDPQTASQYYHFLQGNWSDGSPMFNNLGQPTKFLFSGDPSEAGSYSEVGLLNASGDRRMIVAHDLEMLQPNTVFDLSYAIVFQRSGSNLESVEDLMLVVDSIQEFYDNESPYCSSLNVGLTELSEQSLTIYPNPSSGDFRVLLPVSDQGTLLVHSVNGEVVRRVPFQGQFIDVKASGLSDGIYFVEVQGVTNYQTYKILLNNH